MKKTIRATLRHLEQVLLFPTVVVAFAAAAAGITTYIGTADKYWRGSINTLATLTLGVVFILLLAPRRRNK